MIQRAIIFLQFFFFFNPQVPGGGEISLWAIFSKLKHEDKDLFSSFRNCKKLWKKKKAQNAIISPSFPSYVNWQEAENRQRIGERGRREVAK